MRNMVETKRLSMLRERRVGAEKMRLMGNGKRCSEVGQ